MQLFLMSSFTVSLRLYEPVNQRKNLKRDSIKMNYYHQQWKMIQTECEGRRTGHDSAGRSALWLLEAA